MAPIRTALVGYGFAGRIFHAPLISQSPAFALCAIVSRQNELVEADFPGLRASLTLDAAIRATEPDLVVIATPNHSHAELALQALAAGRNVVVDKPLTVTTEEARRLIAASERAGKLLSVFHNRRWDDDFLTLRRLIDEGALGRLTQFESHFDRFRPTVRQRWREGDGPGAGSWYDLGPHLIDQALCLFGPPLAITADLARQRDGALADDYFHVLLDYASLKVILHSSCLTPDNGLRFAVHGDAASLTIHRFDPQERDLLARIPPGAADSGGAGRQGKLTRGIDGGVIEESIPLVRGDYRDYYGAIGAALRGEADNPLPAEAGLAVMEILAAGIASAQQGRRIHLAS